MKKPKEQKLIRRQVSRNLEALKQELEVVRGIKSWSEYMRLALGMTVSQLAKRLGLKQPAVSGLEKREIEGRLSINNLKKIANAMDCDLVYAFIPRQPVEKIVYDQAKMKVTQSMERAETHMELEDQKVLLDKNERMEDLIEEKIYSKYLWD